MGDRKGPKKGPPRRAQVEPPMGDRKGSTSLHHPVVGRGTPLFCVSPFSAASREFQGPFGQGRSSSSEEQSHLYQCSESPSLEDNLACPHGWVGKQNVEGEGLGGGCARKRSRWGRGVSAPSANLESLGLRVLWVETQRLIAAPSCPHTIPKRQLLSCQQCMYRRCLSPLRLAQKRAL